MLKEKYPSIPDFTTINRRINKLNILIDTAKEEVSKDDYLIIAIDSTGIKITNKGQWMNEKWNVFNRKGYIKIHVAVNIKTKEILALEVTDEKVYDGKVMKNLVEGVLNNIMISR